MLKNTLFILLSLACSAFALPSRIGAPLLNPLPDSLGIDFTSPDFQSLNAVQNFYGKADGVTIYNVNPPPLGGFVPYDNFQFSLQYGLYLVQDNNDQGLFDGFIQTPVPVTGVWAILWDGTLKLGDTFGEADLGTVSGSLGHDGGPIDDVFIPLPENNHGFDFQTNGIVSILGFTTDKVTHAVPDKGSTALLFALGLGSALLLARFIRRASA